MFKNINFLRILNNVSGHTIPKIFVVDGLILWGKYEMCSI
jgi:hypothetical protein